MLSQKTIDRLNQQINLEIYSSHLYLQTDYNSLKEMFEKIYEHEQVVTSKINDLVHLATTEQDYATLQFLQWYVAEQHQEEFLFKSILDKIKLIGTEGQGIFFIDREIANMAANRTGETTAMDG